MRYVIPIQSKEPTARLEHLQKQDSQTFVREFLNIQYHTARPKHQAVNPYLMVMNALKKLQYWYDKGMGEGQGLEDQVFMDALDDCQVIMNQISMKMGGYTSTSIGKWISRTSFQASTDAFSSTE